MSLTFQGSKLVLCLNLLSRMACTWNPNICSCLSLPCLRRRCTYEWTTQRLGYQCGCSHPRERTVSAFYTLWPGALTC